MNNTLNLCLIVEMEIDPKGVDVKDVKQQILSAANDAVGKSLLRHKAYISPYTREYSDVSRKEAREVKDTNTKKP